MEKSDLAKEAVTDRVLTVVDKFPDLALSRIKITLEMENSPQQAGPDSFTVKVHVASGRYRDLSIAKSSANLYAALSDVIEHLLEKLNRFGDRSRVKERGLARKQMKEKPQTEEKNNPTEESLGLDHWEQLDHE